MISLYAVVLGILFSDQVVGFESFSPGYSYRTFNTKLNANSYRPRRLAARQLASGLDTVKNFVNKELGFKNKEDYSISESYTSFDGVKHYFLKQLIDGHEVFNGNIKVNVLPDGSIQSFGDTFYRQDKETPSSYGFQKDVNKMFPYLEVALEKTNLTDVLAESDIKNNIKLEEGKVIYSNLSDAINSLRASEGWLQLENNKLVPVWSLDIMTKNEGFNAKVNQLNSKVESLTNWKSEANYRVYPVNVSGPDGQKHRSFLENPEDKIASPLGWHDNGTTKFNTTQGNNVIAMVQGENQLNYETFQYETPDPEFAESVDGSLNFDFEFADDPHIPRYYKDHKNASITNAFYVTNALHDLLYKYGFNEAAGNFQTNNFNKGGLGDDPLIVYAQYEGEKGYSSMLTPPDGQSPNMKLGIYGSSYPPRDGSMDNSIIIHEFGHGLSTRLVCGPSNVDCLKEGQGKGMGEGWSDTLSCIFQMKSSFDRTVDMAIATYTRQQSGGIRKYPYSTSFSRNKLTYKDLKTLGEAHEVGHVWATMLYEVYWNLVEAKPFTPDWLGEGATNPKEHGNSLFLTFMMGGMSNLIDKPNFIEARDAILKSEEALTKGAFKCAIWRGFAKRGLGLLARANSFNDYEDSDIINSYDVPADCDKLTEFPDFYEQELNARNSIKK